MRDRQLSESIEKRVKRFAKRMANRMDIAEYQELLFGLLFIKCASESGDGKNGLLVPKEAHWDHLKRKIDALSFGDTVVDSMKEFESLNVSLKGLLPLHFCEAQSSSGITKHIFEFIDSLPLDSFHFMDLFGRIYEYLHTGTGNGKNGHFFTPDCVAKLLVEMLEPLRGKIYDPCCGTGTMFVHVINYINTPGGNVKEAAIYGQESNATLYRLCRMNLALRGIDNSNVHWTNDGSLLKDAFPRLKADYVLANPPFNERNWGRKTLKDDPRWRYGTPPAGNANFAWIQHVFFHLSPGGSAGILLPNSSLSTTDPGESSIRQGLVEAGLVESVMRLPDRLFYNTSTPACLWILSGL